MADFWVTLPLPTIVLKNENNNLYIINYIQLLKCLDNKKSVLEYDKFINFTYKFYMI